MIIKTFKSKTGHDFLIYLLGQAISLNCILKNEKFVKILIK